MADIEPLEVTKKIRNELILLAKKVKAGDITPTVGNSVANIFRTALYAEQVRAQQEKGLEVKMEHDGAVDLSEESKAKLDELIKILDPAKEDDKPKGSKEAG